MIHQDSRSALLYKGLIYLEVDTPPFWNVDIESELRAVGWRANPLDLCLNWRHEGDNYAFLSLFVDHCLVLASSKVELHRIRQELYQQRPNICNLCMGERVLGLLIEGFGAHGTFC